MKHKKNEFKQSNPEKSMWVHSLLNAFIMDEKDLAKLKVATAPKKQKPGLKSRLYNSVLKAFSRTR